MADSNPFYDHPILNSPYKCPTRHWELTREGVPTQNIKDSRRPADFITPIPKPRRQRVVQGTLLTDKTAESISTKKQEYHKDTINRIRHHVAVWRSKPELEWHVTPVTSKLLCHWRSHKFSHIRPFFCQVEAVETAIWLSEVAPHYAEGKKIIEWLDSSNAQHNDDLPRLALKLATGAGKTTVMAMLIAWQTLNAVRSPRKEGFTKGFLVITPGITIRDRLRVLLPNGPDSYYRTRELVPIDMLQDMQQARVVITNYHALRLRETLDVSPGTRALLEGRHGDHKLESKETEGGMLQRVMSGLLGFKSVMVFNDEAHHCYRQKEVSEEDELKGDEKKEAEENREAARVWFSGLEILRRRLKVLRVFDLSATPFFLSGSGYVEGTLFPWTMSDFSLMDAIECGIVKLPRVPVSNNISSEEVPIFRKLWENIRKDMPKKSRGAELDPLAIPAKLQTALSALYGHYEAVNKEWEDEEVPPCFIVICNNTATSKLLYDYISGFHRESGQFVQGRLRLFRNYDDEGNPLPKPNTLLIDSKQLESGDVLDSVFKAAATDEIERFKRDIRERGDFRLAAEIEKDSKSADAIILREVMNTVGKAGRLGGQIRCVVSVSMLTEGWDANNVTHVLGVRAFGTQLLCEQVVGRALRRMRYDLNDEGLFEVEYSDVLGIPFDFTSQSVPVRPKKRKPLTHVFAVSPDRDVSEIVFPHVVGYRAELPKERLQATFSPDSILELTPEITGPTRTQNAGIIGREQRLDVEHLKDVRDNTILMHLTRYLLEKFFRDADGQPKLYLFGQLKKIVSDWFHSYFRAVGGTYPAQLMYQVLADLACERIHFAITQTYVGEEAIQAILDPYTPQGSSRNVSFMTSKPNKWQTRPDLCHVNWVIADSSWEAIFCEVIESHPKTLAYVKNEGLGFEVPYAMSGSDHMYIPDFVILVDDGGGKDDPLHLVVEIKGRREEDAKQKHLTMDTFWVPGVNRLKKFGRWAFLELTDKNTFETEYNAAIKKFAAARESSHA